MVTAVNVKKEAQKVSTDFPSWVVRVNADKVYAFKDIRTVDRKKFAVRISIDGVFLFSEKENPSIHYLNTGDYLTMEELKRVKNKHPMAVGGARINGELFLSDCMFEPGLVDEDFKELMAIFKAIVNPYL